MDRYRIDEPEVPPQINIVPMIDVIFAILTFFVMATLFLGRFESLSVNLPQAQSARPQKATRAVVTLNAQGLVYLNQQPVQLEALSTAIRQLHQPAQELVVLLNADGQTTHQQVIAVMDQIRQVKGARLAIATQGR